MSCLTQSLNFNSNKIVHILFSVSLKFHPHSPDKLANVILEGKLTCKPKLHVFHICLGIFFFCSSYIKFIATHDLCTTRETKVDQIINYSNNLFCQLSLLFKTFVKFFFGKFNVVSLKLIDY